MTFSVGLQIAELPDPSGVPVTTLLFYPCAAPEIEHPLGPFTLAVAPDAAPLAGPHPLVILSHGSGGSPHTHRELARYLAAHGFVVAAPEHPRNHRRDNSLAGTIELLEARPRTLRAVADACAARFPLTPGYAVVGHSLGGYTALALAGGRPVSLPHESPDRIARAIAVEPDPRVSAVVLLAPALPWFRDPRSLAAVRVPILMIASYADEQIPYFYFCQHVVDGVAPGLVDDRRVEGAHHHGFLSPWPAHLRGPQVPPSLDPPGFDRRRFLDELYPAIAGHLTSAAGTRR